MARESDCRVVRLAGRLAEGQVPALLSACAGGPVRIDLSDLLSADPAGVDALRRVRAAGATFVAVPGYIQMKLDSAAGGSDAGAPTSSAGDTS